MGASSYWKNLRHCLENDCAPFPWIIHPSDRSWHESDCLRDDVDIVDIQTGPWVYVRGVVLIHSLTSPPLLRYCRPPPLIIMVLPLEASCALMFFDKAKNQNKTKTKVKARDSCPTKIQDATNFCAVAESGCNSGKANLGRMPHYSG